MGGFSVVHLLVILAILGMPVVFGVAVFLLVRKR